jgi:hypothetical protein
MPAPVVVVDDAREIRARLQALRGSGLPAVELVEAVAELVDSVAARSDDERLTAWIVREVPMAADKNREVEAVRHLRHRIPGLGLGDAVDLVRRVQRDGASA